MVALFGQANWWLPTWAARILRVRVPAATAQAPAGLSPVPAAK
jgi:uncharacterized membrane protein YdfJ with MMPL/SSD domain